MARPQTTLCWPTNFWSKWLAVFFGAALVGVLLGALRPKPVHSVVVPQNVTIFLMAYEVYADGTPITDSQGRAILVPATLQLSGSGTDPVPGSDQPPLSTNRDTLTPLTRPPGTKMWIIYKWRGDVETRLVTWPTKSTDYAVQFNLHRPNPHS